MRRAYKQAVAAQIEAAAHEGNASGRPLALCRSTHDSDNSVFDRNVAVSFTS